MSDFSVSTDQRTLFIAMLCCVTTVIIRIRKMTSSFEVGLDER